MSRSRRSDRARLGLVVAASVLASAALIAFDATADQHDPPDDELPWAARDAAPDEGAGAAGAAADQDTTEVTVVASPPPLGAADGLALAVPAASPVVVSYHEASFPQTVPIAPAGRVIANENATRFADPGASDGLDYRVQVSRGRVQGPTTAVDVVLRADEQVLAPATATVTDVRPYRLYDTHPDVRVELAPTDRPDLRVVLIHVQGVLVREGDVVAVGEPIAAAARAFPFEAVVDRATAPERFGHVHLEVKSLLPTGDAAAATDTSADTAPDTDG